MKQFLTVIMISTYEIQNITNRNQYLMMRRVILEDYLVQFDLIAATNKWSDICICFAV